MHECMERTSLVNRKGAIPGRAVAMAASMTPSTTATRHMTSSTATAFGDSTDTPDDDDEDEDEDDDDEDDDEAKKKKWHQNHEKEIVVFGIAVATLFAMLKDTPKLKLYVDDNSYELGLNSSGYSLRYSEDRILATYKIKF